MCSIVAHENGFQLLFQKFGFATDIKSDDWYQMDRPV